MTFLLSTIRAYKLVTTDDLFAEVMLIRRLGNGDDLPATWRDLESALAELERLGDIKRDGDFWLPVYRQPAKRAAQKALF